MSLQNYVTFLDRIDFKYDMHIILEATNIFHKERGP